MTSVYVIVGEIAVEPRRGQLQLFCDELDERGQVCAWPGEDLFDEGGSRGSRSRGSPIASASEGGHGDV